MFRGHRNIDAVRELCNFGSATGGAIAMSFKKNYFLAATAMLALSMTSTSGNAADKFFCTAATKEHGTNQTTIKSEDREAPGSHIRPGGTVRAQTVRVDRHGSEGLRAISRR